MPFAIVMVVSLVAVGLLSNSHSELLERATRRAYGSSLKSLLDGDLFRLFSSLFLTAGGWRFFASVLMLGVSVGWAEWSQGSKRTVLVFFGVHLLTSAMMYFLCVMPLATMEIRFAELLADARDVGPSAGYYGCLGFALAGWKSRWRMPTGFVIFLVLFGRLLQSATSSLSDHPHLVIGDVAHLIAFPLGLLAAFIFLKMVFQPAERQD